MTERLSPAELLEQAYQDAAAHLDTSFVAVPSLAEQINAVVRSPIRAGVRVLLACSLAKIDRPTIDIRQPYSELGGNAYSGRTYDERYISPLIHRYALPCNSTTAFLTPALRTKNIALEPGAKLGGRDRRLYDDVIAVIDSVERGAASADSVLRETIRDLLMVKLEQQRGIETLLDEFQHPASTIPMSSEDIISIVESHLRLPRSARLPVLVVAAAYEAATEQLGEQVLPLQAHNAADQRTRALGDVEIALLTDQHIITVYEMKMKAVTTDDLDRGLQKLTTFKTRVDQYLFITTDIIDPQVARYATSFYRKTGGIEFAILDCIGFLRHFLHLFHRLRLNFLNAYQSLILSEPESAIRQPLKEALLALRNAAESSYAPDTEQDE